LNIDPAQKQLLSRAFATKKSGRSPVAQAVHKAFESKSSQKNDEDFETLLAQTPGRPALGLELLKELCTISRESRAGDPLWEKRLLILVESADMLIPSGNIPQLSELDRHRISTCQDWFLNPNFMDNRDAVILLTESIQSINQRVLSLPQILKVEVDSPNLDSRRHFIEHHFLNSQKAPAKLWGTRDELAKFSAGLSLHALKQLLKSAGHKGSPITQTDVTDRVQSYIESQLGEGVVEFKQPTHTLQDVVGFEALKSFLEDRVITRFLSEGSDALSGAIVCGPIGGGKTFIFEAVASMLGIPVLVLKGIRSKWFGGTDIILERLYRVLMSLNKVMVFIDEADTQLGGVGAGVHQTERRATGKMQTWMSDPRMKGRVIWLQMTARIHMLSPDLRRKGRGGDLIVPVLDPVGEDRLEFNTWMVEPVIGQKPEADFLDDIAEATKSFSAAEFASLRSELKSIAKGDIMTQEAILARVKDELPGDIGPTRRYQTLQAMLNTTRRSLLPGIEVTDELRKAWMDEIRTLEALGIE
jgi:SpoVK/Ycf46/Vps4 family AAA+-type ATPase